VSATNSLAARFPAIAAEWHRTMNGRLRPRQIVAGSGKPVWWRCAHDASHVFPATPNRRTARPDSTSCPFCARRRRAGVVRSLAEAMPVLTSHWHRTRNGDRMLARLGREADRPLWWRCPSAPSRPWRAEVKSWAGRRGCRFCAQRHVSARRTLAFRRPMLAAEWHPTRNGRLTPEDVSAMSGRRVWWRCRRRRTHVWAAVIARRVHSARTSRFAGCPFCAFKRRAPDNSVAARAPAVAAQWHPTRNGRLHPHDVGVSSSRRVWWRCRRGQDHVWAATILSRAGRFRAAGCPFCAGHRVSVADSLARRFPTVAAEWHPTKNGRLTSEQVGRLADRVVWWQCPRAPDHALTAAVRNRTRRGGGTGCPFCRNKRLSVTTSLAVRVPEVAAEWHPTRNRSLTPDRVLVGSHRKAWWRCPQGPDHEWRATIGSRTSRRRLGCPFCRGFRVSLTNSFAGRFPAIAAEWHPTRNRPLAPDQVTAGSSKRVWWRCASVPIHVWQGKVAQRARGQRCPMCRVSPPQDLHLPGRA